MLYNSSEVTAKVGNGKGSLVTLKQSTHYPFDENIKIEISTGRVINFPLYLRIPNWCRNAKLMVNGEAQTLSFEAGSYARIERKWKQGDMVELICP